MKRVFLSLTMIAALAFTSCKETPKEEGAEETKTETTDETAKTDEKADDTATVSTDNGVPSFSDEGVQAYVDSYSSLIDDYKKAAETKDMTAFASLGTKAQELATKGTEVLGKLKGADLEKYTTFMTEKGKELTAAMQKFQ